MRHSLSAITSAILSCLFFALPAIAVGVSDTIYAELRSVGEGQADATDVLQRAVSAVDGLLEIPPGTFLISRSILVDLRETGYRGIRGANGATRIIMTGSGPALRIVGDHQGTADPASVQAHTWDGERFPVISDIEILGKHVEADGIELYRTMQCTIRNVLIRKCRYGVHLVERNRNFLLADSHIYDGGDTGVFFDDCNLHQANLIGNHISYNKRAGIRQSNGDVHNIQITSNDIEYNSGSEASSGEIVLEAPDNIISEYTIASNTIQAQPENHGANILIVGDATNTPHAARIIAITGNIIGDRDKNIVLEHASRVTIAGNTIYGGKTLNVHVKNAQHIVLNSNNIGTRPSMHAVHEKHDDGVLFEDSVDCIINGNVLSSHRFGDETSGGSLTLRNTRNCRISDCQIINPAVRGVHLIGGVGCVVSDNTIVVDAGQAVLAAIAITGDASEHLVQNNLVRTPLGEPIQVAEGAAAVINNTIRVLGPASP